MQWTNKGEGVIVVAVSAAFSHKASNDSHYSKGEERTAVNPTHTRKNLFANPSRELEQ